jgi:hypothetical protein
MVRRKDEMSEIRTRLADALDEIWNNSDADAWSSHRVVGEICDKVLSLPGVAIVELPEPDSDHYDGEYGGPADRLAWLDIAEFDVSAWNADEVQIGLCQEPLEPIAAADARKLAAALLAAANAAEQPVPTKG